MYFHFPLQSHSNTVWPKVAEKPHVNSMLHSVSTKITLSNKKNRQEPNSGTPELSSYWSVFRPDVIPSSGALVLSQHTYVVQWLQKKKAKRRKSPLEKRSLYSCHRKSQSQGIFSSRQSSKWSQLKQPFVLVSQGFFVSQTEDMIGWSGSHGHYRSCYISDPTGGPRGRVGARGGRVFTPRSPTAVSWQTCGSLGRWTPPRVAGRGGASP